MKKKVVKRLLCLTLTVLLAGSGVAENVYAAHPVLTDVSVQDESLGEETLEDEITVINLDDPSQIPNYGYYEIKNEKTIESIYALPSDEVGAMEEVAELPEKYVNSNLPNTRHQGTYGTCWAHASIAVAEANLMKQKVLGEGEVDASELHLAYFSYHTTEDPLGGISGDIRSIGLKGENYLDTGGNTQQATRTLFAWMGAAAEETAPYSDCYAAYTDGLDHAIAFQDVAHIKNAYVIDPVTEREEAKRLIYDYGALTTSYFAAQSGHSYTIAGQTYSFTDFYNLEHNAYYCPIQTGTNHAVTIVGWDDNFPKENFPSQPEGDGAWLIRNSWTTFNTNNYNGYFWMSYYDKSLRDESYTYEMESADNYDNNYQYDGTYFSTSSYNATCANVFEVKASEQGESLEAIAFETDNTNLDYEVEIYTKVEKGGDPSTGELVQICKGSTKYAGYHTVKLNYPITLNYGDRFAVVVKLIKDDYWTGINQEWSYSDSNFHSIPETKAGESFYYTGSQWEDVYGENYFNAGNYCIKAYTKNFEERVEPTGILIPGITEEGITLGVEEEFRLMATALPVNAAEVTVSYESSDENIVTVEENGNLRGVAKGTAYITVTTVNGISKSFEVKVVEKVNSITIQGEDSIYVGDSYQYTISWQPEIVTPAGRVQWSCDQPEILRIDENTGEAQALKTGNAVIRAELDDITATMKIRVGVDLDKADLQIECDLDSVITFTWKPVPGAEKYTISREWDEVAAFEDDGRASYSFSDTFYQGETENKTVSYSFCVESDTSTSSMYYSVQIGPGYKITYDIPNGKNHPANPGFYRSGNYVILEEPIVDPGYYFAGWYADSEYMDYTWGIYWYDEGDMVFYAKVLPISYDVVFHSNTDKDDTKRSRMIYGEELVLPQDKFSYSGYELIGWNTKADGTGTGYGVNQTVRNLTTEQYGEVHLYAQWKGKEYEVSFDANGGYVATDKGTVNFGQVYGNLPVAQKDGYKFLGWFTQKEDGQKVTEENIFTEEKDITLYAHWEKGAYSVTFQPGEGGIVEGNEVKTVYTDETYGELPKATRAGYRFTGWYLEQEGEYIKITSESRVTFYGNHVLTAGWEEIIVTPCKVPVVSVDGEIEEGVLGESEWIVISRDAKIVLSGDEGDTLYYAYADEQGNPIGDYQEYTVAIPVTENTKLCVFADRPDSGEFCASQVLTYGFKLAPVRKKIVYVITNGKNHIENPDIYQVGESVSLKDAIADTGYLFEGWYRDSAFQNRTEEILSTDTEDFCLWAKMVPITYYINYCSNDDTADNISVMALYDEDVVLKNDIFKRKGYKFAGWNTKEDGTGIFYDGNQKVRNLSVKHLENLYLYAQWEEGKDGFYVEGLEETYSYTGSAIKPFFKVYDGEKELVEKKDYKVTYKNNKNAGIATIKIQGLGNYKGELVKEFEILPVDITAEEFSVDNIAVSYNKKEQKPVPGLYYGEKKLSAKKDYFVEYYETEPADGGYRKVGEPLVSVKEPGHYKVCVVGKGNYDKTREVDLYVGSEETTLVSKLKVEKIGSLNYTGVELCPSFEVKHGNVSLNENEHYTLKYYNNKEIGTATIVIEGINENGYSGSRRVTFKIKGNVLKKQNVKNLKASYEYTGRKLEPFGAVGDIQDDGWAYLEYTQRKGEAPVKLVKGTDYEVVSYVNNRDTGTAAVVLKGINGYSGTLTLKFKIQPATAENKGVAVEYVNSVAYAKGGVKPVVSKVIVNFADESGNTWEETLAQGKDYTISYANNKNVTQETTTKLPKITLRGKGNYKGVLAEKTFLIVPQDISKADVVAKDKVYNGKVNNYKTTLTITDPVTGKKLDKKDYDTNLIYYYDQDTVVTVKDKNGTYSELRLKNSQIQSKDIIPAGIVLRIETTGKGDYYGEIVAKYKIAAADFTKAKVEVKEKEYTGEAIEITKEDIESVKIKGKELDDADYAVVGCYNNVNKGKGTVILEGRGNYGGRIKVSFKISQKKMYWW